jgi:hypothetical protein
MVAVIRVLSVIAPVFSSMGTLKSALIRMRLPEMALEGTSSKVALDESIEVIRRKLKRIYYVEN